MTTRWLRLALLAPMFTMAQGAAEPAAINAKSLNIFLDLLKEFKVYNDCHDQFPDYVADIRKRNISPEVIGSLPEGLLKARFSTYNVNYELATSVERKRRARLKDLEAKLKGTPLSDQKSYLEIEAKTVVSRSQYKEARAALCRLSVDANMDVMNAVDTLPADKRVARGKEAPPPKLPGRPGKTRAERMKETEGDKLNLTPVDDEFYATQLGKKIEKDLGGRADYWSYDFDKDELYVKVGTEVGKLTVREETPGSRSAPKFIRTYVGSSFSEPKAPDTRVDSLSARGKFLTKNPTEESLFGKFPKNDPIFAREPGAPGSSGTGHDHNHK